MEIGPGSVSQMETGRERSHSVYVSSYKTDVLGLVHVDLVLPNIAVDCGQLVHPVDGQVNATATTFGSVASYVCREGYVIVNGSGSRTCQADAHWSGTRPTCKGGPVHWAYILITYLSLHDYMFSCKIFVSLHGKLLKCIFVGLLM